MKEITVTKTVVEVTGYEASDGTHFNTKEECMKYEQSAEAAVNKMFEDICVKPYGDNNARLSECAIFESFGYGSEDYYYVIADIRSENELKIANMFSEMYCPKYGNKLNPNHIGKRVLIAIGNNYDQTFYVRGTEEEMVEEFKKTMARFFRPEEKGEDEN